MRTSIIKSVLILIGTFLFQLQNLIAQVPTNIPGGKPEPVPFTPVNILVFIIIPLGLLVFYIWWLRQNRKKAEEEIAKANEKAEEEKAKANEKAEEEKAKEKEK
ncbi:MAG: hypothetical protein WD577_07250 [Bacteroidales bacterium]